MGAGELIFAVWVGALGFVAGLVVEAVVNHNELDEVKKELAYTRKKITELREGIVQTQSEKQYQTVEVIEINDNTLKEEPEDYFEPF